MDDTYAEVGTEVILGKHTRVGNCCLAWAEGKECYVGRKTRITMVVGKDCIGALCCRVQCDYGKYRWRVENMILASDVPLLIPEQKIKLRIREDDG